MSTIGARLPSTGYVQVVGLVLIAAYAVAVVRASRTVEYNLWGGLVVLPLLILLSIPLLLRAGRADPDPIFLRLLLAAFVAKALATAARYWMAFVFYDGSADAGPYHFHGVRLAESYSEGDFGADLGRDFIGTGFIRAFTGFIYTLTGPSIYISYAFYAWLGFWGLYFMYRAFQTGVPDGQHRRYAFLVLFLPSMLYWPSSLGKEAFMTMGIGLAAFGGARVLQGQRGWLLPLAAGLTATTMVRPHVTAILFCGFAVALVLRRSHHAATPLTPVVKGGMIAGVLGVGMFFVSRAAEFLGVEASAEGLDAAFTETGQRSSQGGSEFNAAVVRSPVDLPWAAITVVLRPFVFEADSMQSLIAAAEGTLVMVLVVLSLGRLRSVPERLRRQPYLIFCITYSLMFVYAFSNIANFGILSRQRVQVLPFVLVFLALPALSRHLRRTSPTQPTHEGIPR